MALPNINTAATAVKRIRIWYGILIIIMMIFGLRLFYVEVIRYGHYHTAALSDQLKQYQIPATRGIISAQGGSGQVPIVLNQTLYTVFADPPYIKQPVQLAASVAHIIGGSASTYETQMKAKDTQYVVLANKVSASDEAKITKLQSPGLGATPQDFRVYPQGDLASQLLGFVDNNGQGQYGVEQALNKQLTGTPGQLKAITDASGVPLAASKNNVEIAPKNGSNVTLTINLAMQQQLESILAAGVKADKAPGGSALIIDPSTGAVKAMANFPTYDPSNYAAVSDSSVYQNGTVSNPIEVGSIMKTLTTSAALNLGVITPTTVYYDPGSWNVDGSTISNVEIDGGPGPRSIGQLLNQSLNTGATWMLMQMGGGQINTKARDSWYDYMTTHFRLGQATGIEQGYEASGYIPQPEDNGQAIDLTYAESAFGQGMTATPIQMAAAVSSVLNGGTYYKPYLVQSVTDDSGKTTTTQPKVEEKNVVSASTSQGLNWLMQYVVNNHADTISPHFDQNQYEVGGKTGTAQIAEPGGGYYPNTYNGTYIGFVGGDKVQYVIIVYIYEPTLPGYAGVTDAQPVFVNLAHMLINDSYVTPKTSAATPVPSWVTATAL